MQQSRGWTTAQLSVEGEMSFSIEFPKASTKYSAGLTLYFPRCNKCKLNCLTKVNKPNCKYLQCPDGKYVEIPHARESSSGQSRMTAVRQLPSIVTKLQINFYFRMRGDEIWRALLRKLL